MAGGYSTNLSANLGSSFVDPSYALPAVVSVRGQVAGPGLTPAVSSGERNGPGEDFAWFHPVEGLSRAAVELPGDGIEVRL